MNGLIEEKLQELQHICRQHHVRRIDLFGSATASEFDPLRSDLDFMVMFQDLDIDQYVDAYSGLLEDLQTVFQHPVDLAVDSAIKNPYFRQAVDSTHAPSMESHR
jgi:uncharacterized protein